jgi:hypothetical protein
MHKPFVIAPERLVVPCISDRCLAPSLVDEVDVIPSELFLQRFIKRPGPVVSPVGSLGEGMLQPHRPERTGFPLLHGWVWSEYPIAHRGAHQPILHHAFSSSQRCEF